VPNRRHIVRVGGKVTAIDDIQGDHLCLGLRIILGQQRCCGKLPGEIEQDRGDLGQSANRFLGVTRRIVCAQPPADLQPGPRADVPMSDVGALPYRYLSGPGPHGLQLGCGWNPRAGWLNTDREPREGIVALDVTRRFPLPDACLDNVYSEHMIEHIPFEEGQHMLHECFRVLRSGGVVRTTTPSISILIRLFLHDRTQLEDRYVAWSAASLVPPAPGPLAAFVFHSFVRNWGTSSFMIARH